MNCPHCQHPLVGATASDFFLCVFDAKAFVLSGETDELICLESSTETIKQVLQHVCVGEKVLAANLLRQEQHVSTAAVRATLQVLSEQIQAAVICSEHEEQTSFQTHRIMFLVMAVLSVISFFAVVQLSWWFLIPAVACFLFMLASRSIYQRVRKIKMNRSSGGTLLRGVVRKSIQIGMDKAGLGKFLACVVAVQLPGAEQESAHLQIIHVAQGATLNPSDAWVMRWHGEEKLVFDFPMKGF
ncbi:MAG: hypothetical protein ACRCYO_14645 [Bacteroidia bacterium]